ncbi:hypothetical protein BDD12DRAFT_801505 [Trichophaea hybrida]|nr:hypothetical protein BDD12DRAFT_801505 [Trichophaea hybrida]
MAIGIPRPVTPPPQDSIHEKPQKMEPNHHLWLQGPQGELFPISCWDRCSIDKQVLCGAQIEVPVALALASPVLLGPNCLRVKLKRSGLATAWYMVDQWVLIGAWNVALASLQLETKTT